MPTKGEKTLDGIESSWSGKLNKDGKPKTPWFYNPPLITEPPKPQPTDRINENHSSREVTLTAVTGIRWWAHGLQQISGKVQYTFRQGTNDIWLVIELCKGECQSLERVRFNNGNWVVASASSGFAPGYASGPGFEVFWYPGTPSGTVDSHLAAVDGTWNEAFAGTAHAVVHLSQLDPYWPQLPTAMFEMKTYKPIDPRTDARAYSENLFVQWYDWLLDPEGKAMPAARINKASFITAANIGDQMVGSRRRYWGHPLLTGAVDVDDVIKQFKLLTDSYFFEEDGQWKVVVDRPDSAIATYGDEALSRSVKPRAFGGDDLERPNRVIVEYTDTTNDWKSMPVTVETAAVTAGTDAAVPVTFKLPAIHDRGAAVSRASYILSLYQEDTKLAVRWNETAAARKLGEMVTQNVPARGLSFSGRIVGRTKTLKKNIYDVVLLKSSASRYVDDTSTSIALTQSTLPAPGDVPPDVTLAGVAITEESFNEQVGLVKTRARIAITNPNFYFLDAVELWFSINGGEYRFCKDFPGGSNATVFVFFEAVNELGVPYSFKFIARSRFGQKSAGAIKTPATTFAGKTAAPPDVPHLWATLRANEVYLYAQQPNNATYIVGYEWRRGLTTDTWETAKFVQQTKGLVLPDKPPNGTWRYFVKAYDQKGYSTSAATTDVTVVNSGPALVSAAVAYGAYMQVTADNSDAMWIQTYGLVEGWRNDTGKQRYLLCRRISPQTIDAEIASNGYTNLSQWEASLDSPRRKSQALCFPLEQDNTKVDYPPYSGQNGSNFRNNRYKVSMQKGKRIGIEDPATITNAEPYMSSTLGNNPQFGPEIITPGDNGGKAFGFRLASNSRYAQTMFEPATRSDVFSYTEERLHVMIAIVDLTTDSSGNASYTLPTAQQLPAACTLSVTPTVIGNPAASVSVKLTSVSNTAFTFNVTNGATGAALVGATLRCYIEDRGLGGMTSTWSV